MIETIYIDLDGVLADFASGVQHLFRKPSPFTDPVYWNEMGLTEAEFWKRIDATPNFWRDLPAYSWARGVCGVLSSLERIQWKVLLRPGRVPDWRIQRLQWLSRNIIAGFSKWIELPLDELGQTPKWGNIEPESRSFALLIDDSQEQCDAFIRNGGQSLLFPNRLNGRRVPDEDIVAWLRVEIGRIRKRPLSELKQPKANVEFDRVTT